MKLYPLSPHKLISSLWKLQILCCPIIVFAQEPAVTAISTFPDLSLHSVTDVPSSEFDFDQLARNFHLSWSRAKASLRVFNSTFTQGLIPLLQNLDRPILKDSVDYCSNAAFCHAQISRFVEDRSTELVNAILSDSQLNNLSDSAYQKALLVLKSFYENFSLDGLDTFNNYFKEIIEPLLDDTSFDIFKFDIALEKYKLSVTQLVDIYSYTNILRHDINLLRGDKGHE
jgi:hypothetical protein